MHPGPTNLITDVPGLLVGNANDSSLRSGVTVLLAERPVVAAVDVRGGGPGTRDTAALGLAGTVEEIHGLVFSGGSAFGLNAASGVQSWLRNKGIGFDIGGVRVPIVPQAILFDLLNGGDKNWGDEPPYARLASHACENATHSFALGTAGAGYGATTARYAGGLGSASLDLGNGVVVGALAAANPVGCVTVNAAAPNVWAASLEIANEFFSDRWSDVPVSAPAEPPLKRGPDKPQTGQNTTLCCVATNAKLTKTQCFRLAVMAQTGFARAIYPVHTPLDGDVVFALSTGTGPAPDGPGDLARIGALAANTVARAITRGICESGRPDGEAPFGTVWSDLLNHV